MNDSPQISYQCNRLIDSTLHKNLDFQKKVKIYTYAKKEIFTIYYAHIMYARVIIINFKCFKIYNFFSLLRSIFLICRAFQACGCTYVKKSMKFIMYKYSFDLSRLLTQDLYMVK